MAGFPPCPVLFLYGSVLGSVCLSSFFAGLFDTVFAVAFALAFAVLFFFGPVVVGRHSVCSGVSGRGRFFGRVFFGEAAFASGAACMPTKKQFLANQSKGKHHIDAETPAGALLVHFQKVRSPAREAY